MEETNEQEQRTPSWGERYALFGGVVMAVTAGLVGLAGPASAQEVGSVTEMATTAASDLTPIILGVGGALVAVAVVRFGVRWVLSAIGRGGRA